MSLPLSHMKKKGGTNGSSLWMYFILFAVAVSVISIAQIHMGGQLMLLDNRREQQAILVPGLKEWRSEAIDRFKRAHPKIEDKDEVVVVSDRYLSSQSRDVDETTIDSDADADKDKDKNTDPKAPDENVKPLTPEAVNNNNNELNKSTPQASNNNKRPYRKPKDTITYAIAVTECPDDNHVTYGAAVLAESIKNMSIRRNPESRYDYNLYAFVHEDARKCNAPLYSLGYTVLNGKSPHAGVDKEFIKVYALSLTNHKIVVTLEIDTLLLQPLDELFDLMLDREIAPDLAHTNKIIPERVDFISTKTASQLVDHAFFVARTSQATYQEMSDRMEQQYAANSDAGDDNKKITNKSFDDFLNDVYGDDHFELDNCVYNTYMGDDCFDTTFDKIQLAHFSSCGAPWDCQTNIESGSVCSSLLREWHRNRRQLDQDLGNEIPDESSGLKDTFGYCSEHGSFLPVNIVVVDPESV